MAKSISELQQDSVASYPSGGRGFSLPAGGNQPLMLAAQGARKVAFGSATLTFPGGAPGSNNTTVTHGLGTTPVSVVVTAGSAPTTSIELAVRAVSVGASTFLVSGTSVDGSNQSGTTTFYWVAIG